MMTFREFLEKHYDLPDSINAESYHRGHAQALVRYVDEVLVPETGKQWPTLWPQDRRSGLERRQSPTRNGSGCRRSV